MEEIAINNSNLWAVQLLAVLRPKSSQGIEENSGTNYPFFLYEMLTV